MTRPVRIIEPEKQKYTERGRYGSSGGNTRQGQLDLRLKHELENHPAAPAVVPSPILARPKSGTTII